MKYDEAYLYSRDIDWFCIIGGIFCHVASAGGLLPDVVNDRDKLRDMQKRVFDMDYIFRDEDIYINQDFLYQRFGNNQKNQEAYLYSFIRYFKNHVKIYLYSFIKMSRKGFVSLDRTNVMDITDHTYHVVCYPKHIIKLNIQDLPNINGHILNDSLVDIHLLELFK